MLLDSVRPWLVVVASVVTALSDAPSAFAVYKPILIADPVLTRLGASGDVMIGFAASNRGSEQPVTDDPTARTVIAVPAGYRILGMERAFGTRAGSANAKYEIEQGGTRTTAYLNGAVTLENPASFATNDCAPGDHDAVLVVLFTVAGQKLSIPMYLDTGETVNGAAVSARIEFCFDAPRGGALLQGRFFTFAATLRKFLTNPMDEGTFVWRGFFTPYDEAWKKPLPPVTVESQSIVGLPVTVTVQGRRTTQESVVVSGTMTRAGRPVAGGDVRLLIGPRKSALHASRTKTTADRDGHFRMVVKSAGTIFLRVQAANTFERAAACSGTSTAPGGCVFSGSAYFLVLSSVVRIPR